MKYLWPILQEWNKKHGEEVNGGIEGVKEAVVVCVLRLIGECYFS